MAFVFEFLSKNAAASIPSGEKTVLDIAIIGSGAAGLASAKNAIEQGHNVVIYEQAEEIGGIWWYTDRTEKDDFGIDIYTPIYKELMYVQFVQ